MGPSTVVVVGGASVLNDGILARHIDVRRSTYWPGMKGPRLAFYFNAHRPPQAHV